MKFFKLTSKRQATILKEIRKKLDIKAGDSIFFQMLKNTKSLDTRHLKTIALTLSEWNSKEDENAYNDLQNI